MTTSSLQLLDNLHMVRIYASLSTKSYVIAFAAPGGDHYERGGVATAESGRRGEMMP